MDASTYVNLLRACYAATPSEATALRQQCAEWGQRRSEQFDDPEIAAVYSQFADVDSGVAQTGYINDYILRPFRATLPSSLQQRLEQIPVIVLPTRTVNACAAKIPGDGPIIIIDSGLLSMCHFYLETKPMLFAIRDKRGMDAAVSYVEDAYRFVVQYYRRSGEMPFPLPPAGLRLPVQHGVLVALQIMALETFVIAHELAHIHAGHLDEHATERLSITEASDLKLEVYQRSWQNEYEADSLGWLWYQKGWPSISQLRDAPPEVVTAAPLFFFEYLALIEANVPDIQQRYSSHPSAPQRYLNLLRQIRKEGTHELFQFAVTEAEIVFHMPKL